MRIHEQDANDAISDDNLNFIHPIGERRIIHLPPYRVVAHIKACVAGYKKQP